MTEAKTITGSLRMLPDYMAKLRQIINSKGKGWFYKWIDKEHGKLKNDES